MRWPERTSPVSSSMTVISVSSAMARTRCRRVGADAERIAGPCRSRPARLLPVAGQPDPETVVGSSTCPRALRGRGFARSPDAPLPARVEADTARSVQPPSVAALARHLPVLAQAVPPSCGQGLPVSARSKRCADRARGRLLRLMVTGVDDAMRVAGDPGSRSCRVASCRPGGLQEQGGTGDLAACPPVFLVVGAVDPQTGPIVLTHAMDDRRVLQGQPRGRRGSRPIAAGAGVWYHASGSALITRSAGLSVWPRNHQCHQARAKTASVRSRCSMTGRPSRTIRLGHHLWMVHRRTERDQGAAVVPGYGEPAVAEVGHQPHDVAGHRALGRLRVVGSIRRKRRTAVAAQVGGNDRVMLGEPGRDRMPGRVGAWVPVQQHDRGARAPVSDPQANLAHVHVVQLESVEHRADATRGPVTLRWLVGCQRTAYSSRTMPVVG